MQVRMLLNALAMAMTAACDFDTPEPSPANDLLDPKIRPDVSGTWRAELIVPAGPTLPIIFHIKESKTGVYKAKLDSPD